MITAKPFMIPAHAPGGDNFDRRKLSLEAAGKAYKVRSQLGIGFAESISPFDVAWELKVDVRFQNVPSMDGMYCQLRDRNPLIVLASERPAGRQNFTCAHEIGHHKFGHGTHLDEFIEDAAQQTSNQSTMRRQNIPEEFLADRFAGFLLMPKAAVDRAFARRSSNPAVAKPLEIYNVACYLGVGYRTLVEHLCFSLGSITRDRAEELRRWATRLPKIRADIAGQSVRHVVVVDAAWENRSIDVVVDDVIHIPIGWSFEGSGLVLWGPAPQDAWQPGNLVRATRQSTGILTSTAGQQLTIHISRRGFVGLARYRYLDDPDDDFAEGDANED